MRFNLAETRLLVPHRLTRLLAVVLGMTARKVSHAFDQGVSAQSCPYKLGLLGH